jgi:hypothetical protein
MQPEGDAAAQHRARTQQRRFDQRRRHPPLPSHQRHQQGDPHDDRAGGDHPAVRRLADAVDDAQQSAGGQQRAARVEAFARRGGLVGGDQLGGAGDGDHPDGYGEQEDPPPAEVGGDEPAEDRPGQSGRVGGGRDHREDPALPRLVGE